MPRHQTSKDIGETKKMLFKQCNEVSKLMKSLSHPVRLKVLCSTLEEEQSVNSLTEICGISQSAMSQFLKRMKNEKLLKSRKEGTFVYYFISDKKLLTFLNAVRSIYCN
jgi:ArsR family transcriptional regulator, virulence genes transcriptional regulator